jgi:hypothetical protein
LLRDGPGRRSRRGTAEYLHAAAFAE